MSNDELKAEIKNLKETFEEYHTILNEVYENMYDLSIECNKIKEILNQRNG